MLGVLAGHERRLGRQLGDVRACDECAIARAREYGDAALVVVGEAAEGGQELLEQLGRERVEDFGAIDRHDRHAAVHADVDRHQPVAACACRYSTIAVVGVPGVKTADALLAQRVGVGSRDGAADEHEHVVGSLAAQQLEDAGHERHVRAREDGDSDGVGILLDDRLDDLLGGLVQPRIDDFHACIAKSPCDDLCSAIVAIRARASQ